MACGAKESDVMLHGTWKSQNGLSSYTKQSPQLVPSILAGALASSSENSENKQELKNFTRDISIRSNVHLKFLPFSQQQIFTVL